MFFDGAVRCRGYVTARCPSIRRLSVRLSVPSIDVPLAAARARAADIDGQLHAGAEYYSLISTGARIASC